MKLVDILAKQSIGIDEPAKDWQEAVTLAGKYLLKDYGIEERYIQAMINAVLDIGPYMVVAPGIAIAHARPEDGALKICLSIVQLRKPVEFGSSYNDPVDLVFGLAGKDHHSHIEALRDLASLLQNPEAIAKIRQAKTVGEIYSTIEEIA